MCLNTYTLSATEHYISIGARGIDCTGAHRDIANENASVMDEEKLVAWFTKFAVVVGDVVPVRVRLKQIASNVKRLYFSYADVTLLSPVFTLWRLCHEHIIYLDDHYDDTPRPPESSFLRTLAKRCPSIGVRSGCNQVSNLCSIYRAKMGKESWTEDAELLGDHLKDVKAMRYDCDTLFLIRFVDLVILLFQLTRILLI